jgi:hypothetical protein
VLTALLLPTSLQVSYLPSSLPVYPHSTSPFLPINFFTTQSRFSYRLVLLFLWIRSWARGYWNVFRLEWLPRRLPAILRILSVLRLGTKLRLRSTSLSVCMCKSQPYCVYVCVLLLTHWQVNHVCVFHSTDPSEYCVYFRLSNYIINNFRIFPCAVLSDSFSAISPAGSSILMCVITTQQGGWVGYMGAVYHDIVSRT